jgi:hypothetical protein
LKKKTRQEKKAIKDTLNRKKIRKMIFWGLLLISGLIYIIYAVSNSESELKDLAMNGKLIIARIDVKHEKNYKRSELVYHYSFTHKGKKYSKNVKYHYYDEGLAYNIGDRIFVLYSKDNAEINCDYRYLKDNNYGVDTNKYSALIDSIGFKESPHTDKSKVVRIKF